MVKSTNCRVMHTLSKTTKKMLSDIADLYGMTESAVINMLVVSHYNSVSFPPKKGKID